MHTHLKLVGVRWTGHITRMPDEKYSMENFKWKRRKDTQKASLKDFNIPQDWEQIARDRANCKLVLSYQKGNRRI